MKQITLQIKISNDLYKLIVRDAKKGEYLNVYERMIVEGEQISEKESLGYIIEQVNQIFMALHMECASKMPGFWYHNGEDYKVIPTKWNKGYQSALNDAQDRINKLLRKIVDRRGSGIRRGD